MQLSKPLRITIPLTACLVLALAQQARAQDDSLDKLQKLIAPRPSESAWMTVPWMPCSDIYAARKKAAEEGKPLLLWYMAGEPLGTC